MYLCIYFYLIKFVIFSFFFPFYFVATELGGLGSQASLNVTESIRVPIKPMSDLRFYCAILSRNFIARQNRKCEMECHATSQQSRNSVSK